MVLSQAQIIENIESGKLEFIPPIDENQIGPTSIDLRLGFNFFKIQNIKGLTLSIETGIPDGLWVEKILEEKDEFGKPERYYLDSGEFVVARTLEIVKIPTHLVAFVEGRSTYARMGVSVHQAAPWIHPGFNNDIKLEMMNNGPARIELTPKMERPCQLTFFELTSEIPKEKAYGSRLTDKYQIRK